MRKKPSREPHKPSRPDDGEAVLPDPEQAAASRTGDDEFDRSPDASNPQDGDKEPFPRAVRLPYR